MCKLVPSRKYMGKNALVRDGELKCPDDNFSVVLLLFTENLPDRVRFREATTINTWKHLRPQ